MKDPARAYREAAVRGATPVGLIIILYEEIVRSLRRAQRGIERGDIEQRTLALSHAITVIGHLEGKLDFEKGGRVAINLARFYGMARNQILQANVTSNRDILEMLSGEFFEFIQAWQQVDLAVTGGDETAAQQAAAALGNRAAGAILHSPALAAR